MKVFRDFTSPPLSGEAGESSGPAVDPAIDRFWKGCEAAGLSHRPVAGSWFEAGRYPLGDGAVSITADGRPAVRRPLADFADTGTMRWALQPNCFNHLVADYGFLFQVLPTGPQETSVTARWIVHRDAVEGVDYDLANLIHVWMETSVQDKWLVENNQLGVCSSGYRPGPYSTVAEEKVLDFIDWYCAACEGALV